jgi:hypothetical protein
MFRPGWTEKELEQLDMELIEYDALQEYGGPVWVPPLVARMKREDELAKRKAHKSYDPLRQGW